MEFKAKIFKLGNGKAVYIPKNVAFSFEVGSVYTFVYTKSKENKSVYTKPKSVYTKSKSVYTDHKDIEIPIILDDLEYVPIDEVGNELATETKRIVYNFKKESF